ncbi:hypothetical protein RJ640_012529, partial [Escallonia rubra]
NVVFDEGGSWSFSEDGKVEAPSEIPTENDDVLVDPTPTNSTVSSPMTSDNNISCILTSSDETPPRKAILDQPLIPFGRHRSTTTMKTEGNMNIYSVVQQLKLGLRFLSRGNWVSALGLNISVASILGAAGLILALRDGKARNIKSLEGPSEKLWAVPGLQNLGNTCFLNVQSIFPFEFLVLYSMVVEEAVERDESMPLALSLDTLLEELCTIRHGMDVLSPRRVMLAVDHYIPNFNLTSQQDAEEAFFHILSSLREELSEVYVPNRGSLADVTFLADCRILDHRRRVVQSEQERWQRSFLGPFDGILGSSLTCQSCSFQISLDFQCFHSLHLPPMAGCSVKDCLKQFFVAEQLENYYCSHCWHTAAVKYLALEDVNETDIRKLTRCSKQDSCDCRRIPRLKALPWSNSFSRTFKQLKIARTPKVPTILCLHLQRASMNVIGELVKIQGHIRFPLSLDISWLIKSGAGLNNWGENLPNGHSNTLSNQLNLELGRRKFNRTYRQMEKSILPEDVVEEEELRQKAFDILGAINRQTVREESSFPRTEGCSNINISSMHVQSNHELCNSRHLAPPELHRYHLVSVVQHYGVDGNGHYKVYRRVEANSSKDTSDGLSDSSLVQWFCISDSEVYSVSEKDVLAAEASLLFYEKV